MTAHRGPAWLYVRNPHPEALTRRVALGKALGWLCAHPGCRQATITHRAWCWTHDVDEVAVWRATQGDPVPLYRHERVAVLERLRREGLPSWEIARRLGVSTRTVDRWEARLATVA